MSMSRLTVFCLGLALIAVALPVRAQGLAPTPRKAPRTPVKSTMLVNKDARAIPVSRLLSGRAMILDTERLQLQGVELRLFGVIPPAINAPLGPQTRSTLDSLARHTVTCKIKDRERNGTYLATCSNDDGADFGVELLRRGLAVTDRSTIQDTNLATPYFASERAAQSQKLGLWETKNPSAATTQSIHQAASQAKAAKDELARLRAEKKEAEEQAERLKNESVAIDKTDIEAEEEEEIIETSELINETNNKFAPLPQIKPEESSLSPETSEPPQETPAPSSIASLLAAEKTLPVNVSSLSAESDESLDPPLSPLELQSVSWFERHQLFITGLLFLFSALTFVGGNIFWKTHEKKEELRSMAAALRGELMAARAIARARLSKWSEETQDNKTATWPRIRVIVFQAYLAKLGNLGAELSRQIASLYGQTSDLASYYSQNEGNSELKAKKHALQTLLDHIEEILPRLIKIEDSGTIPQPLAQASIHSSLLNRLPLQKKLTAPPTDGGTPATLSTSKTVIKKSPSVSLADNKAEIINKKNKKLPPKKKAVEIKKKEFFKDATTSFLDLVDEALEKATQRLAELRAKPTEEFIPDYANLTEEEIEALAEDYFNEEPLNKKINRAR